MKKIYMTSQWRHHPFDFNEILIQICKRHIKATYQISDWSNIRELRNTVGKITKNNEEKMDIEPLWLWPLTQGHHFQWGSSKCAKQPLSENGVQIDSSVLLEFCSQAESHTHTQTPQRERETNCSENITPPWFRGGVMNEWRI